MVQTIEDLFVYEIDFTDGISAGSTSTSSFQIQADSDFKWIKSCQFTVSSGTSTDQTGEGYIKPALTLQITDSSSGRQLFLNPAPLTSVFGVAELPFVLPLPRIFKARSNISLSITNFSSSYTYYPRLSFIGTKLFTIA